MLCDNFQRNTVLLSLSLIYKTPNTFHLVEKFSVDFSLHVHLSRRPLQMEHTIEHQAKTIVELRSQTRLKYVACDKKFRSFRFPDIQTRFNWRRWCRRVTRNVSANSFSGWKRYDPQIFSANESQNSIQNSKMR